MKLKNESADAIGLSPVLIYASGDPSYLPTVLSQEWRCSFLLHVKKLLSHCENLESAQVLQEALRIMALGDVTFDFLIGFFASLWASEFSALPSLGIKEILDKTGQRMFVLEADVVLALEGNFSEQMHRLVEAVLGEQGEALQYILSNYSNLFTVDCILGVCIGVKLICGDVEWISSLDELQTKQHILGQKESLLRRSWKNLLQFSNG